MTAEDYAREATKIIYSYDEPELEGDDDEIIMHLVPLFQSALKTPAPVKFVKGFVPSEKGLYFYETTETKTVLFVEVFPATNRIFIDREFWMNLSSATGRFSHRIIPPGEEE